MKIKEVIVVEGEHDRSQVLQAVDADIIVTGGARIKKEVYLQLERVADTRGIIILTDPDYAGGLIRKQIEARFPKSKHAFIPRARAMKAGDVGVENAHATDIKKALEGVRTAWGEAHDTEFVWEDMLRNGLVGTPDASSRRERLGAILRIGYANSKSFFKRLNSLQVSRREFEEAIARLNSGESQ